MITLANEFCNGHTILDKDWDGKKDHVELAENDVSFQPMPIDMLKKQDGKHTGQVDYKLLV